MAHPLPQLEAMLKATESTTARTLADALLCACAPHSREAADKAIAEIKRRAGVTGNP